MPTKKGPDTYELTDLEICALQMAIEGSLFEDDSIQSYTKISLQRSTERFSFFAKIRDMLSRLWRDSKILYANGEDAKQVKESAAAEIHRLMNMVMQNEASTLLACSHTVQEHYDALISVRFVFPDPGDTFVN